MYTCRECEAEINQATELCPHCGADLTLLPEDGSKPKKKPPWQRSSCGGPSCWACCWGPFGVSCWFVVSPRTGQVALDAETHAVQALGEVYASLVSYAAAQGGATLDTRAAGPTRSPGGANGPERRLPPGIIRQGRRRRTAPFTAIHSRRAPATTDTAISMRTPRNRACNQRKSRRHGARSSHR